MSNAKAVQFGFRLTVILLGAAAAILAGTSTNSCKAADLRRPNISGQVTDSSGAPLEQAKVLVYTAGPRTGVSYLCPSCYADCAKSASTDAHGRFEIPSLDPALVFRLLVLHPGFDPAFVDGVDPQKSHSAVAVKLAASRSIDPDHVFIGKVLGPLGAPVAGATVEPVGISGPAGMFEGTVSSDGSIDPLTVTGQNGQFALHVNETPVRVMVLVRSRGLAPVVTQFLPAGGASPATIALTDGATLTGSVITPGGRPASGVEVRISAVDTDITKFTGFTDIGTDSEGRFIAYNLPTNTQYGVYVRMDISRPLKLAGAGHIVQAASDDSSTKVEPIRLEPAGIVAGRITLSDGSAIRGGAKVIVGRMGFDSDETAIQSDGSFSLSGVPRGEPMILLAVVPNYHVQKGTPGLDPNPYSPQIHFVTSSSASPTKIYITMVRTEAQN